MLDIDRPREAAASEESPAPDFRRVGSWLAAALDAQVATGTADTRQLSQVSSLFKLLNDAAGRGSERDVITAFVEALTVWDDVESWAYRADVTGRFTLDVFLPGSDRAVAPDGIDLASIHGEGSAVRLSAVERVRIGFARADEVAIARVQRQGATQWLIATLGSGDPAYVSRLGIYTEVLSQVLSEVTAAECSRLTWAMLQHFVAQPDALGRAAQGAMTELAATIDAPVGFAVWRSDGSRTLAAGDAADALTDPQPVTQAGFLVRSVSIAAPYAAAIGVSCRPERLLSLRDQQLLETAASTMSAWLVAVARGLASSLERRHGRSLEEIVDQHTKDAELRRQTISVIVLSGVSQLWSPHVVQAWVTFLRGHLRGTDLAGRLSSGDVGILLLDTPVEGAHIVARRIRQFIVASARSERVPPVKIGVASRAPGSPRSGSLLALAHADAATDRPSLPADTPTPAMRAR